MYVSNTFKYGKFSKHCAVVKGLKEAITIAILELLLLLFQV